MILASSRRGGLRLASLTSFVLLVVVFTRFAGPSSAQEQPARESRRDQLHILEEHYPAPHDGTTSPGASALGFPEMGPVTHQDPVAPVILEIVLVLLAAKIGGHVADKLRQPAVLGELLVGVGFGALPLLFSDSALGDMAGDLVRTARTDHSHLDVMARIGVILLLFEVGLESSLEELAKVGLSSLLVATVGVAAPFALGYGVSAAFIHDFPAGVNPMHVHLFIGATLAATSVGITARVLSDLGRLKSREARIILGAAVIDDIMGLVILAVVSGVIVASAQGTESSLAGLAVKTTLKAVIFLVLAIFIGLKIAPYLFRMMAKLRGAGLLITSTLAFCFLFAWMANAVGLATIVGSFAAGLVLSEAHLEPFKTTGPRYKELTQQLHTMAALFVPIFFVQMGMKVDLTAFLRLDVLLLALALTVAAIAGKQACSLVVTGSMPSRLSIGFGMIPRGEVGLIFASIGFTLGVVGSGTLSAVVIMVILTTLVTPPLLKLSMGRLPTAPGEE